MIITPSPPDRPLTLAFDLIRRYAARHGWIPIGWRSFTIGPWIVTVNGTPLEYAAVPPYHALVEHRESHAILLFSPFGGEVCGRDAEDLFIHDMEAALEADGQTPSTSPMTKDERTLLLLDFYRSMQSLDDAFTAFERGHPYVADGELANAIAVMERLRVALITKAAATRRGAGTPRVGEDA
jgi:hypothetical protein